MEVQEIDISPFLDFDIDELLCKLPLPPTHSFLVNNELNSLDRKNTDFDSSLSLNSPGSPTIPVHATSSYKDPMPPTSDGTLPSSISNQSMNNFPENKISQTQDNDTHKKDYSSITESAIRLMDKISTTAVPIGKNDYHELFELINQLPPTEFEIMHTDWHSKLLSKGKKGSPKYRAAPVTLSKHSLNFGFDGDARFPLLTVLKDNITMTVASKSSIKYRFVTSQSEDWSLNIEHKNGVLREEKSNKMSTLFMSPKQSRSFSEQATFELKVHRQTEVKTLIHLIIEQGIDHFLVIRGQTDTSAFGLALDSPLVEKVTDLGHNVPVVLKKLREALISRPGWEEQGVFLVPGEDRDISVVLRALSQNQDKMLTDITALASSIKLFFREMPYPVLQEIPQKKIVTVGSDSTVSPQMAVDVFNQYVTEPLRSSALWLFDLLNYVVKVAKKDDQTNTRLTIPTLSICFAPNLYRLDDNVSGPELLLLRERSTAVINYISKCIEARSNI